MEADAVESLWVQSLPGLQSKFQDRIARTQRNLVSKMGRRGGGKNKRNSDSRLLPGLLREFHEVYTHTYRVIIPLAL